MVIVNVAVLGVLVVFPAAQAIDSYALNITVDPSGESLVELWIPPTATETFRLSFRGGFHNFNANTDCSLQTTGMSVITCTPKSRSVQIKFETNDFVTRVSESRFYFASNFAFNRDLPLLQTQVVLPDGMILVDKNQTQFQYVVYPEPLNLVSDGRRITITWQTQNWKANDQLRFEVLYEQIVAPPWFQLRLSHFVLFGIAFAVVFAFIYLRYFKKSEKMVLSVLDEYERKVVDILLAAETPVNQKKIVQETNFSKAKVSRVVKSLVGRGLVEVERRGRTNLLKLLKKKLQI